MRIPESVEDAPVAETFDEQHQLAMTGAAEGGWRMPGPAA